MLLLGASVCPCDSGLEIARCGLFDRKPSIRERLRIVSNETQPALFLSRRDPVRFREDTYERSIGALKEGGSQNTDSSLPLRVVLFRNMMRALILEVGCIDVSIRMKEQFP